MLIIPSILTDNPKEAVNAIEKLNDVILPHGFPLERIQIDIDDGTFLGVKTIEPQVLSNVNSNLKFDYHLMVNDPASWVRKCVRADRIIGQIEHMGDRVSFTEKVSEWKIKTGLAVDFGTGLELLNPEAMRECEVILLMSYPAGMGGQDLNGEVYDKIENLKEIKLKGGYDFKICLDGGITLDNIKRVKLTGVDEVVIGKRLTEGDIEENLEKFYKACY
jgi:ribulose-phosphate 3-epimerase